MASERQQGGELRRHAAGSAQQRAGEFRLAHQVEPAGNLDRQRLRSQDVDLGLDLEPVRLLCKLKGEDRRIYEFSADYVDSMANLVSA